MNAATYGGAVACSHQAAPVLVGNLFEGNLAFLRGSAVYSLYSYPDVTSSTIAGNVVMNDEPFDPTGAIHNHISKTRTTGSILWGNASAYYVPTQLLEAKGYYTTYCDIEGGHEGEGNADEDPGFVGFGSHPYAVGPDSPCVNAGAPDTAGLRLPQVDLAGRPRVDGGVVDMGAYEGADWTGVEEHASVAGPSLSLRPNPSAGRASVSFVLPARVFASLRIYDVAGRRVRTLVEGDLGAGPWEIVWDGTDDSNRRVATGVYLAVLKCQGGPRAQAKIVLLR
jgi:hypothetical protein